MPIVHVGIDLAKNMFSLHGVDESGRAALVRPSIRRDQLLELVAKLPPCTIGMEACPCAHLWARQIVKFGHVVKLMAPKLVAGYRMSGNRGEERRGLRCARARRSALARCCRRAPGARPTGASRAGDGRNEPVAQRLSARSLLPPPLRADGQTQRQYGHGSQARPNGLLHAHSG